MTARTFDPFADEQPTLKLGEHGSWTLGDITDARKRKLDALVSELDALEKSEDATVRYSAEVIGKLCEAACDDADGLADLIVDLTDADKHGAKAIGVSRLSGVANFVREHIEEIAHLGES